MRRLIPVFAVVVFLAQPAFTFADGLLLRLPEDGTRAKYSLDLSEGGQAMSGSLEIRSVGKEDVDGKACRWIEMTMEGPGNVTLKLLVPEEELKLGGSPLHKASKVYLDQGLGSGPDEITDPNSPLLGPFPAFLSAPATTEKLEESTLTTDAGEFECQGFKTQQTFKQGDQTIEVTSETRFSDTQEAAFGTVEFAMEFKLDNGRSGTVTVKLTETGDDAKPKLEIKSDDDGE